MKIKISIIGAGSWGTSIAKLLHENGHKITLWSHNQDHVDQLLHFKENKKYLPGIILPNGIFYTNNPEDIISSDVVIIAVPSKVIRETIKNLKIYIKDNCIIINLSKGLEDQTLFRISEVIESELPNCKICTLSGPSHSEEVSKNIPTICVASSKFIEICKFVQNIFTNQNFRVYTNPDIIGVELGGALKNVIAIAAGISDGLGFGDNTKAAIMTRGLAEISKIGVCLGANILTFNGLSGIGDLIATCTSNHSRNRKAGILLGKGNSLEQTISEVKMVIEGIFNARSALELASKNNIEVPIISEVNDVLFNNKAPQDAVSNLMTRVPRSEMFYVD